MSGESTVNGGAEVLALALQHHQAGRLSEAEHIYRQILLQQPNQVDALHLLGTIAHQSGQIETAIAYYRQALAKAPALASVHSNLGIALKQLGLVEEAIHHYNFAIAHQPNAQFHYNLGVALQEVGKLEEAIQQYHTATVLNPNYAEAYNNLGYVQNQLGQIEEAIAHYHKAINCKPNFAEAHRNLAESLLLIGDFTHGFAEYEWRWQLFAPHQLPNFTTPPWDGSYLAGKTILLYAEQGLGDTIQFIRYAPLIKERGGRVIATCLPSQVRLLKTVPGIEQVFALDEELPLFHTQAPLMSLPYLFGTTPDTVPAQIPYLTPPSHNFKLSAGDRLKVGITWAGNPGNRYDIRRTCGLQPFLPLLATPEVDFYSLQIGSTKELAQLPPDVKVKYLSVNISDFADTAAIVAQLDLVITIDTSVAHLAGALGKPTWVVLPFVPDWRWMLKRQDSPWYPTMRLFRQESIGDWSGVFARVAEALQSLVLE